MPRFVVGITLTPQERAQYRIYSDAGNGHSSTTQPAVPTPASHTCSVTLPDGTACPVSYSRYSGRAHQFRYAAPLSQRLWFTQHLSGGVPAIEEKAQALCVQAFQLAQEAEQKAMQRKSLPKGIDKQTLGTPELRIKTADACAGKYAACLMFSSGRLTPVGLPTACPEEAQQDLVSERCRHIQLFGKQKLVVGICCRYLRKWIEPQFLASSSLTGEETVTPAAKQLPQNDASAQTWEQDPEDCEDHETQEEAESNGPWDEDAFVEGE